MRKRLGGGANNVRQLPLRPLEPFDENIPTSLEQLPSPFLSVLVELQWVSMTAPIAIVFCNIYKDNPLNSLTLHSR